MDIISLHKELRSAGYAVSLEQIGALVEKFRIAIAEGKIKHKVAPDGESLYALNQIFAALYNKAVPNVPRLWSKAVEGFPKLAKCRQNISFSSYPLIRENQGINAVTFTGMVALAAILKYGKIPQPIALLPPSIYVLKDAKNEALKIGYSASVEKRLYQHKSSNPFLIPIAFFPVKSRSNELALHRLLSPYRIPDTTEWYIDSDQLRGTILDFFYDIGVYGVRFND